MKKTITAFAFVALFSACNNNPKTGADTPVATTATDTAVKDTSLMDQGQTINMNGVSDTIVTSKGEYVKVQPKSLATTEKTEPAKVKATPVRHHRAHAASSSPATDETVYSGSDPSAGTSTSTETEPSTTTAPVKKKKGWSSAAKGAVIGAGTGAVAGAIISKKKGTGAIIGGLLGAGGGYIIGKSKDKKKAKQQ